MRMNEINPEELWKKIREGNWSKPTAGVCDGYAQGNLVILPKEEALEFMIFAKRNPKACPMIDVLEPGEFEPLKSKGADLRRDVPLYRVYTREKGFSTRDSIEDLWRRDLVSFVLGCSFTFEAELLQEGVPVRHIESGRNVPMYDTTIQCKSAGRFHGNMVVSMRPMKGNDIIKAIEITSKYPEVHGSPVHIGDPGEIGIKDLQRPDYGDSVPIHEGEIPVFWACGVTPQNVLKNADLDFFITHSPGHMFVTKIKNSDLSKG